MKILLNTGLLFMLFTLFFSCTETIEVEVDSSFIRLVVEASVTTDTMVHAVRLSTTSDYFNNKPSPAVTGALVSISDGQSTWIFVESSTEAGHYYSSPDFYAVPGNTYSLEISNVDIDMDGISEQYSANSKLNPVNPVDSL